VAVVNGVDQLERKIETECVIPNIVVCLDTSVLPALGAVAYPRNDVGFSEYV
jgi:hypothetical protein